MSVFSDIKSRLPQTVGQKAASASLSTVEAANRVSTVDSFAKSSGTTAYTAGDVVGPATTPAVQNLANVVAAVGGAGAIKLVKITTNNATVTNGNFRVYFYTVAPTAIADNSPFTLLWADRAKLVGKVDITLLSEGSGSDAACGHASVDIPFVCDAADTDLYAVIVAEGAYTPASGQSFQLDVVTSRS